MNPTAIRAAAIAALLTVAPQPVVAQNALAADEDIKETYGSVPGFFRLFSDGHLVEAWGAFKALQMNPDVAMTAQTRELIGVAVAAQGECQACFYFHVVAASANGASEAQVVEAATIGAATRRLHRAFEQAQVEMAAFQREANLVIWGDPRTVELRAPTLSLCQLFEQTEGVLDTCD